MAALASKYTIKLEADGQTISRDGDVSPFGTIGPLAWRITKDGEQKLLRNAMTESSFKYDVTQYPGATFKATLESMEDGVTRSNVLTYSAPVALNPKKWVEFQLESRIDINHNTRRLRFHLPAKNLGARCVSIPRTRTLRAQRL